MAAVLGLGFIKLAISPIRRNISSNSRSPSILFPPNTINFSPNSQFSPSSLLIPNSTSKTPFLTPLLYNNTKIKSQFEKDINLGEDYYYQDDFDQKTSLLNKKLDDSGILHFHNISIGHFDSNNHVGGNGQGNDGGGTSGHIDYGTSSSDDEEEERLHREWLSWWLWQCWQWWSPIRRLWNKIMVYSSWRPLLKLIGLPPGLCSCGMANQTLLGGIVWNYIAGNGIVPVTLLLVRFGEFVLYFAALYVLELLLKGTVSLVSEIGTRLRLWWDGRHSR